MGSWVVIIIYNMINDDDDYQIEDVFDDILFMEVMIMVVSEQKSVKSWFRQ